MAAQVEEPVVPNKKMKAVERLGKQYLAKDQFIECKKGGLMQLSSYTIAIPPRCLKHDASLKMTLRSRASPELPDDVIPLSPEVGCDVSHVGLVPGSEIEVEMSTYCFTKGPGPVQIALLQKAEDSDDWIIKKRLPLGMYRKVKFRTSTFTKFCLALTDSGFGKDLTFLIYPHMYSNNAGQIKYYLTFDDKPLREEIRKENKKNGLSPGLAMAEPSYAKFGENFVLVLQCTRPAGLTLGEDGRRTFTTDDVIEKGYIRRDFQLEKGFGQLEGPISVEYHLTRPNGETLRGSGNFFWEREHPREEPTTNQPPAVQNVTLNVNIAPKTSASPQAKIDAAERDVDSAIPSVPQDKSTEEDSKVSGQEDEKANGRQFSPFALFLISGVVAAVAFFFYRQ